MGVSRVADARAAAETAVADAHLVLSARPDGAAAVVFLAEPVARYAQRLRQAADGEIPLLHMPRYVRLVQTLMIQALGIGNVVFRIDACHSRRAAQDGDVRTVVEAGVDPQLQPLLESVCRPVEHILFRRADGRNTSYTGRRTVGTAVAVPAATVRAEQADSPFFLLLKGRRNEPAGRAAFFRCGGVLRSCVSRTATAVLGAAELHIHAELIYPFLERPVVVVMIEQVVNAEIHHCVLRQVLLHQDVP